MSLPLRTLLAGVAVLAGSASLAGAQAADAARAVSFGISGGAALPQDDASDVVNTGYIVGAHLKLRPAVSPVGLRFDANYASHEVKSAVARDATVSVLSGFGNVVFDVPVTSSTIRPYLLGGIGVGRLKFSGGGEPDESYTKFGFQLGAGLEIPLSGITGFAEIGYQRYAAIEDVVTVAQVPIRFGVRF
ncbi:MAG TPA: outer membrane beta-barrel protein [Gemmatirosa sp.]|nr:outer membrane beta-barrel protein [Gemmatirosa sp.]